MNNTGLTEDEIAEIEKEFKYNIFTFLSTKIKERLKPILSKTSDDKMSNLITDINNLRQSLMDGNDIHELSIIFSKSLEAVFDDEGIDYTDINNPEINSKIKEINDTVQLAKIECVKYCVAMAKGSETMN
jgi:hypothetical protein